MLSSFFVQGMNYRLLIPPRPVVFVLADCDDVASQTNPIEPLYSSSTLIFGFHFDQRDSSALLGIPASDDRNPDDLSNGGKKMIQLSLIGLVR